jgi:hypothetical protein
MQEMCSESKGHVWCRSANFAVSRDEIHRVVVLSVHVFIVVMYEVIKL